MLDKILPTLLILTIVGLATFGFYGLTMKIAGPAWLCEDYGTMRDKTTQMIGETCYLKQPKAWVTKAAYDEKVDNLYKQDRLQVLN